MKKTQEEVRQEAQGLLTCGTRSRGSVGSSLGVGLENGVAFGLRQSLHCLPSGPPLSGALTGPRPGEKNHSHAAWYWFRGPLFFSAPNLPFDGIPSTFTNQTFNRQHVSAVLGGASCNRPLAAVRTRVG